MRSIMVARGTIDDGPPPGDSELSVACSCSPSVHTGRCEHIEVIARSSVLRNEIRFIQAINSRRTMSESSGNWIALSVGVRKKTTKACWHVARENAINSQVVNYVPVMESAPAKRAPQPIERRVRCKRCRHTTLQRGLCEHESTVLEAVRESDRKSTDDPEPSPRAHRYASMFSRRIFPCDSDALALRQIQSVLVKAQRERYQLGLVDAAARYKAV